MTKRTGPGKATSTTDPHSDDDDVAVLRQRARELEAELAGESELRQGIQYENDALKARVAELEAGLLKLKTLEDWRAREKDEGPDERTEDC